jgi:hypothetical protein
MDSKNEKTTYVVSETADRIGEQILVTADRTLVDRIITAWVEDQPEEGPETRMQQAK